MNNRPFFITAKELSACTMDSLPDELCPSKHLIYSSPAALSFNSPGAEGFGVKRAALCVPGSVMLIVSPGCCARNTSLVSRISGYENRFFYLTLEERDLVTGRHLNKIPEAVLEIFEYLEEKPSVFMICITCVDALLGTDMERVCKKACELVKIPVRPCYMYALTRDGSRPPMVHVRQTIYGLLEKRPRLKENVNIIGFFSALDSDCELFSVLKALGAENIRQVSSCTDYEDFLKMSQANFSILLNPEGRPAADDMAKRLGIPYIELSRLYDIDRNKRQYSALSKALDKDIDVGEFYAKALKARDSFLNRFKGLSLAIGECLNGNPFEIALSFSLSGLKVSEIYGTVTEENLKWIKMLSEVSPGTKIFSNLDPSMLFYDPKLSSVDFALGRDSCYYHSKKPGLNWNEDIQPFGFSGITSLYRAMEDSLMKGRAV